MILLWTNLLWAQSKLDRVHLWKDGAELGSSVGGCVGSREGTFVGSHEGAKEGSRVGNQGGKASQKANRPTLRAKAGTPERGRSGKAEEAKAST